MKKFYLFRKEDLHGHSGLGVVAEGVIFDNGMVGMTWLSEWTTMTMFPSIQIVDRLHSHDGRTLVVIEGRKKDVKLFEACTRVARQKMTLVKAKKERRLKEAA